MDGEVSDNATSNALARPAAATPSRARTRRRYRADPGSRFAVIRRRDAIYRRSLASADLCALTASMCFGAFALGDNSLSLGIVAALPLFVVVVKAMGLYDRDGHLLHKSTLDEVPALFTVSTVSTLLIWLSDGALIEGTLGRGQVLGIWLLLLVGLVALRTLARNAARRIAPVENCLLVGDPRTASYIADKLAISPSVKAELVGVAPLVARDGESSHEELPAELGPLLDEHDVDRVILTAGSRGRDDLLYTIRELKSFGVKVSVLPEASRVAGSSVEVDNLHGVTLLGMRRFELSRSSRLVKRSFDIAGASLGLAILAPVLLAAAIAIKLDSRGPVLFRQRRVGRHGRPFEMLKFRSMVDGADQEKADLLALNEGAKGLFKIADDPRVTRVGRLLRRFQIDELPQLLNVLRGDMSLVGPRPLVPEEDRHIEGWYRRRLDVPPGITGHWQVLGSSQRISIDEMVKLDYLYVANWSLWGDLRLLLQTFGFLAARRGV